MANGWSNEETFKFIELYQDCPEIWNPQHKCHNDKNKIKDAWTRIADGMQVPVVELKKKKDTLLAAFRLNHKKVIASLKSEENEVHKPIWIFYDALAAFMSKVYECKSIPATEEGAYAKDADEILDTQPSPQLQESKISSQGTNSIPVRKRRCNNPPELAETNAHVISALSTLNDVLAPKRNSRENVVEDDCDLYGKLVAEAMRDFNKNDRIELRHEIDGLIIKKRRLLNSSLYGTSQSSSLSTSMYNSPSPVPSNRMQNQETMRRQVNAVALPSNNQSSIESQQNLSQCDYSVTNFTPPENLSIESQQNFSQYEISASDVTPNNQAIESDTQPNISQCSPPDSQSSDIICKAMLFFN